MRQNSRGAGTVGPHRHTYLNPKARPSTNISPTKLNNTTIQQSCKSFQAPSPSVVLFYVAEYSHIITFLPLALFSIPIPLSYELATAFMRTHIPYFPSLSRPQTSQTLGRPQTYPLAPFRTQPALPLPLLSMVHVTLHFVPLHQNIAYTITPVKLLSKAAQQAPLHHRRPARASHLAPCCQQKTPTIIFVNSTVNLQLFPNINHATHSTPFSPPHHSLPFTLLRHNTYTHTPHFIALLLSFSPRPSLSLTHAQHHATPRQQHSHRTSFSTPEGSFHSPSHMLNIAVNPHP